MNVAHRTLTAWLLYVVCAFPCSAQVYNFFPPPGYNCAAGPPAQIPFASAANKLLCNSNLSYASSSDTLQLGAALTPGTFAVGVCSSMTISGQVLTVPTFCANSNIQGNSELHSFTSTNAAAGSWAYGIRARGSISSPAAVQNGDNLYTLRGAGFDGTGYTWGADIHFLADGTPSAGVMPGALDFQTTPAGSNTPVSVERLGSSGQITHTSATPLTYQDTESSASADGQLWRHSVTGSAVPSILHNQTCTDALTCTDWETVTRLAGLPNTYKLFTSDSGFETSLTVTPDQFEFKSNGAGDAIDLIIGSGDYNFIATLNADALFTVVNSSNGTSANAHFQMGAGGGQQWEVNVIPSTATLVTSTCSVLARALTCINGSLPIGITGASGRTSYSATGGFVADAATHALADTNGYFYLPSVAGVPTGVPANLGGIYANSSPARYDTTDNRLYVYNSGWQSFGINSGGANPTASTGLTAVNGSAITFLRSDGAPALSQAIVPTWTGLHTFQAGGVDVWKDCSTGNLIAGNVACGATPSTAINGAIYSLTSTNAGSQPFFGRNSSTGTSAIAFLELGNDTVGLETGFWNTSTTFVGTVSGAGQSGPTAGLFFNQPAWIAMGSHPTIGFGTSGRVTVAGATADVSLVVNGSANNYAATLTSPNTASQSFGENIVAGSNASDFALRVQPASGAATNLFAVRGDGALFAASLATSSAATTGSLCWTTGTGLINVDTTTTCLLSSRRYKKDIAPLQEGLEAVRRLRPVSYRLKDDPYRVGPQIGLIAEDVATIDDRLVSHEPGGAVRAVRYQQLTALLVKAIQEQQAEIDQLRSDVKARHHARQARVH